MGSAALLDGLLLQIAMAFLFLLGKRRTGDGHNGLSSVGTAKHFLAGKNTCFRIFFYNDKVLSYGYSGITIYITYLHQVLLAYIRKMNKIK